VKTSSQTTRRASRPSDGAALGPVLEACVRWGASLLVEADRAGELVGLVEVRGDVVWRCLHFDHEGDRALAELLGEDFDQVVLRRGVPAHGPRHVLGAFREAARARPEDPAVRANLARLREMGFRAAD